MGAKQVVFDHEAREAVLRGVEKTARAVKSTLGPKGRTVVIDRSWGVPLITKDGATVAEEVKLIDNVESLGNKLIREAAKKTSDEAGDGTTTATILAEAIAQEGHKLVLNGASPIALKRGIDRAVTAVCAELKRRAVAVKDKHQTEQIAAIASNNDAEIGKTISDTIDKVGKDGVVLIEEGKGVSTEVDVVEGMQFDRGYLSPHFITDQDKGEAVLERPLILIWEDKISSVVKFVPLLEKVVKQKRPLLIIAEDIESEALATLVVNVLRNNLKICAVKPPAYGDRRKAMMEDIALLTGGKAFFKDLGLELDQISLNNLGQAAKVIVDKDNTTLVKGAGAPSELSARIKQIRKELETTDSDYDREKLQERLAKLAGGVARIKVGAPSETDMKERKSRFEDALNATRAALEEGILPGGGVALLRCAQAVHDDTISDHDERLGAQIVKRALQVPVRTLAENAGISGGVLVHEISKGSWNHGCNLLTGEYGDMVKMGVVDAAKVLRLALVNAASVATMLLTSDVAIATLPKKEGKKKGAASEEEEMEDEF